MEISAISTVGIAITEFKIDLIVWKYKLLNNSFIHQLLFKIDLIVWKYNENMNKMYETVNV